MGCIPACTGADTPWADISQHALGQTSPPPTATAADGTHPTGMHSCYYCLMTNGTQHEDTDRQIQPRSRFGGFVKKNVIGGYFMRHYWHRKLIGKNQPILLIILQRDIAQDEPALFLHRHSTLSYFYHPRMRVGNVFSHVCLCVCVCVCLCVCVSVCLCFCLFRL